MRHFAVKSTIVLAEIKIDITPDLTVYRFSRPKLIEYLLKKVTRLCEGGIVAKSRALTRELAKDGLMDDRKDELLKSL